MRWVSRSGRPTPRWRPRRDGCAEHDRIDARLQEWCRARSADEIVERLWDAGVPVGKVVQPHRQPDLPQLASRNFFEEVEHPVIGRSRYSTLPDAVLARSRSGCTNGTRRCSASTTKSSWASSASPGRRSTRSKRTGSSVARSSGHLTAGRRRRILPGWASRRLRSTSSRLPVASGWSAGSPEAASGMAVFTAILRSYQLLNDQVNHVMRTPRPHVRPLRGARLAGDGPGILPDPQLDQQDPAHPAGHGHEHHRPAGGREARPACAAPLGRPHHARRDHATGPEGRHRRDART